jgi:hypothetical protein
LLLNEPAFAATWTRIGDVDTTESASATTAADAISPLNGASCAQSPEFVTM